ncbi:MAG: NAD-dependent dehydratase [Gammaproteobacteria bacterium CG11_big_fil_rev_8_21_14_0_20_46_22]|nr:MAG: NAD-dependent dehydratase [Gammaproteobacteria bacterium CG12_big_fil_rev_8_21_14_0_65_46_12]PIR12135.1 MAG: NAD-dependent dehydratase [Gammaproteobacteria bacterium CG11_big_fil_rev_8_21_14_0_20_46_22]
MIHKLGRHFDIIARVIADFLMINLALFLAFAVRFLGEFLFHGNAGQAVTSLNAHLAMYGESFLSISLITLSIFYVSGFYTRNRRYGKRVKAALIFQAVLVSYILFGVLSYFMRKPGHLPHSVLIMGWTFTLFAVGGSRLWSVIWRKLTIQELHQKKPNFYVDKKKVLVIGGAGYIGSALLPKLLDEGYSVRILDLFVYGKEAIQDYLNHPRVQIIQADFRQIDKIVEAVRGVSSVVHLGAIVGDPACSLDEDLTIEVNLIATRMIAEICKGFGVKRFVFASTCSVYGAGDSILNETSALNPVSLYAKSKIACEHVLMKMADHEFSPAILRFSTIFGLSGRTRFDLVVNLLTAKACFDGEITVFGGDQWRPFLHVDDAAASVMSALLADQSKVYKEVFNVGGDALNKTIRDIGKLVKQAVPSAKLIEHGQDADLRNYRAEFSKIRTVLGYEPKWTVEQGIQQIITAINEGRIVNYQEPQFNNAKFLKEQAAPEYMVSQYVDLIKGLKQVPAQQ